jgi:hypothetical protein
MKYQLLVYGDASTWGTLSEADAKAELDAFAAFDRDAEDAGVLVAREALQPEGHTLTWRNGKPQLTAELPTEPRQRIGCLYLLECRDSTELEEWASKIPLVGAGGFDTIEIRPVLQ